MLEINAIIEIWDYFDKVAEFGCFNDDIFTYYAINHLEDTELEISIITTNSSVSFLNKEKISDLLLTKDIFFCSVVVRDEDTGDVIDKCIYNAPKDDFIDELQFNLN